MTARLFLATPCPGGQVSSLYARSVLNLQAACRLGGGVQLDSAAHWVDSLSTRAKQGLITQFLGHPTATHLLFVDAGLGFWPDQVFRLLKFDADVTAAAVPRKVPGQAAPSATDPGSLFDFEPDGPNAPSRDGFVRARSAATGLMLLKRGALKALTEKYPDLRYRSELVTDPGDPRYFSTALFNGLVGKDGERVLEGDGSFCRRWTGLGGEIWVDLENALKGLGPVVQAVALYGSSRGAPRP